jgi:cation transport regulator
VPYADIGDLPPSVRAHLPRHAQEIFLAAFNHAWDEYAESAIAPSMARGPRLDLIADHPDRETVARKVAWAAVKRRYVKLGADWVEK